MGGAQRAVLYYLEDGHVHPDAGNVIEAAGSQAKYLRVRISAFGHEERKTHP
jgi:hypothetical protein